MGLKAEGEIYGPLVTSHGLVLVEQEIKPCFSSMWKNAKFPFLIKNCPKHFYRLLSPELSCCRVKMLSGVADSWIPVLWVLWYLK